MLTFLRYVLVLVEAVCSLLLIGVILMQRSKSQGLGMALGGQMGEALFGARMGNVLTRITVILGIVFLVNTTLLAYIGASNRRVSVTDGAESAPTSSAAALPDGAQTPLEMPMQTPGELPVTSMPDQGMPIEVPAPAVAEATAAAVPVAPVPAAVE
jgi:preprotein translocase subunit SecG